MLYYTKPSLTLLKQLQLTTQFITFWRDLFLKNTNLE